MRYPVRCAGLLPVIRYQLLHYVRTALDAVGFPEPAGGVALDPASQRDHGDWSTSVALQVAKAAGVAAREAASRLVTALEAAPPPPLAHLEVAGAGVPHFFLGPAWLHDVLAEVVERGDRWGRSETVGGSRINLEFVSANPTGP